MTRLCVTPLVRALEQTLGSLPLLEFLDSFRYPLAGEFSMKTTLARQLRIPSDWGLEIGTLAEVFRNGSAQLSKSARSVIKGVASAHKARGGRVRVVGHASQRTKDLSIQNHKVVNFRLSVDRAQAVAGELMRQGVAPNSIVLEARGGEDPVYYEWMPAGEAENRRADIYIGF